MVVLAHQGAHVDYCKRCRGVFLDRGETTLALAPEADPDTWVKSKIATPLGPTKLRCPHDRALLLGYRVAFGNAAVEVDVCSSCRGLWVDAEEGPKLQRIGEEARGVASAIASPTVDPANATPGVASYFFQLCTGLPIEVHNPVQQKPVVVYTLLAILAGVFCMQVAARVVGGDAGTKAFGDALWLVPSELLNGQKIWTLLTCTLLHGGLLHLLGNAYFLWVFGDNVEDRLGRSRFLLLYFGSGIAASMLHVAFNASSTIPCLGASGAIAGLMGAYLSMFPKTKLWIVMLFIRFRLSVFWYLGFWIVYQVVMGALDVPGVAWYAHIGGFLAGLAFAPLLKKRA